MYAAYSILILLDTDRWGLHLTTHSKECLQLTYPVFKSNKIVD